jgi:ATP-dependent DNA helicase RecG
LQLSQGRARQRLAREPGLSFPYESPLVEDFLAALPFRLTASQAACLEEIRQDLAAPSPMNRLLQGDVGSGKTVLALAACLAAVSAGCQAALMAPTEILARQHARFLAPFAERLGVRMDLLVGGLNGAEKERRLSALARGETQLVIGTHALIALAVVFQRLGLVVVDEQHRFGVAQRLALREKAGRPNVLVMSATPIPRSLALVLYGDLDVSFIEGLPPGRKPVKTQVFPAEGRGEAYRLLAREISQGGQAFLVAPRIEAAEGVAGTASDPGAPDLAAAEDLYKYVDREILPEASVGLLHGRMRAEEREEVLSDFRQGRIRALVATTVIEVGLDVGEATVMLVEGAERFGLAQLHQLRGRVGRGTRPALCLLIGGRESGPGFARLSLLAETQDGFTLAEEDLKQRGPGDAAGLRQSGLPSLTFARLPGDLKLLRRAQELAQDILAQDPDLAGPRFRLVREVVDRLDADLPDAVSEVG